MKKEVEIKTMPTKEMLEAFIDGHSSSPSVIFNTDKGEFEWISPEDRLRHLSDSEPRLVKRIIKRLTSA